MSGWTTTTRSDPPPPDVTQRDLEICNLADDVARQAGLIAQMVRRHVPALEAVDRLVEDVAALQGWINEG